MAAPRALLPAWLTAGERSFKLEDGAPLLDRLLMEKMPSEIAAMRRATVLADEGYAFFREAARPGRKQYRRSSPTSRRFCARKARPTIS